MSRYFWDRYEVQEKPVGQGKKGVVYQGYDLKNNRMVAIKRMQKIKRAEREAMIMKELGSHQYLPKFYDFFIADNHGHIVMEWIDGEPLRKFKNKHDEKTVVNIIIMILEGLKHLHNKGFLHFDLNRGNIMIVKQNQGLIVKIIDFDRSKLMDKHHEKKKNAFKFAKVNIDERHDLLQVVQLFTFLLTGQYTASYEALETINFDNKALQKVLLKAVYPGYETAQEMIDDLINSL
ncbi:hypothetical protein DS745_22330 [Anaerobacillus alkaliphilus]|uniref:Protein kinase domain-containing protein n=1 Tax=Anaerobacillus alkaliphilus TaxID=1548597 RepID=A0A4Q0VM12_9BACI|nr:protein kinase [Anaerobacillus alkaliphilus]RXI96451.1 hypothetical protein DS745_22330 [Anaerobacillus alkaliphilus]